LSEQRAIAAVLDRETGRVDRLVAKKRELIERLKEKRTALISRTVTRGLPPDAARAAGLPANPPLKPSGIEWIGEIPKHWEVKRLKFELWKIEQGWSPQCDNTPADEGEWGVLKAGAVNGPEFDPNENKRLPDEETPLPEFEIKTGDFLISRANTRELLGSAALVRKVQPKLLLCDKLYRLTIRKRTLNSEFLLRFMRSLPGHFEFERDASGSSASMQNIGQQSVRNLWIPFPPLPEQAAIAAYLNEETAKLDALVGKVAEAVERLQEYRTALITAAVTGKIDVRKAVKTGMEGPSDEN
jgi:type I restriction enzyme S subunit